MKAAIYCRVSTEDQEREGTSLQSQLDACKKLAYTKGYEVPTEFAILETYSGLSLNRPKLDVLRGLVKDKQIKAIIAYTLDRFSRDPVHFIILQDEFERAGTELILVTETLDSSDMGKLISHIKGFAAKLEVEKIKERTMRGKRVLMNQGLLPQGTGAGFYGYDWVKGDKKNGRPGKRIINESEAAMVRRIFEMIVTGMSYFRVAKTLNNEGIPTRTGKKWHPLTIRRVVKNQAYYGYTYYGKTRRISRNKIVNQSKENWIYLAEATPAIITKELFEQTQRALKKTKSRPGTAIIDYILTGHLICGHCGSPLVGTSLGGKYRYYYCTGGRATTTRERICKTRYVRADMLEELIWNKAREVLENPQFIITELQRQLENNQQEYGEQSTLDAEISKLRRKVSNYEYQEKRLINLFSHDEVSQDFILDEISKLKKERDIDSGKIADLVQTKEKLLELKKTEIRLEQLCTTVHQNLDNCGVKEKRLALDALNVKAVVTKDRVQIQGVLPENLVTIVQTSGCLFHCRHSYTEETGYDLLRAYDCPSKLF